jgi:hypothetical protein
LSSVHYLINIIKPLQRKTMFNFNPGSVPFNQKIFVFRHFFMLAFHHIGSIHADPSDVERG